MKAASRVMYIIGLIGNIAIFIFSVIAMIILIVGKANPDFAAQLEDLASNSGQTVSQIMSVGLAFTIYLTVVSLIVLLLTFRALKRGTSKFVHILLMIGGIFAWDIFYVLGGIFGLISRD